MPPPATTRFADAVYDRVTPIAARDEALNWPLLKLIIAVAKMFEPVEMAAIPMDDRPAWGQVLDPDETPHEFHPWMGQFLGVRLIEGQTSAQHIERIKSTDGFKRGTVAALEAAVKATLTGTKYVLISERVGGFAYRIRVTVRAAETPNPAATEAAARAQKAAALVLEFVSTGTITWLEAETRYPGTYADAEAALTTYAAAEALV